MRLHSSSEELLTIVLYEVTKKNVAINLDFTYCYEVMSVRTASEFIAQTLNKKYFNKITNFCDSKFVNFKFL